MIKLNTVCSFSWGMGSVLELVPHSHASTVGEGLGLHRSDAQALQQDWQLVAQDFCDAFDQVTQEVKIRDNEPE